MLLDTSAWIEFFDGTKQGARVREVLTKETCYTSIVSISELVNWSCKEKNDTEFLVNAVGDLSIVVDLNNDIAVLAGKLNFERKKTNKKWGIMDSFVLATAMYYYLKILSKDPDFGDLQNVEILPKD
jgi:predicted nucleic acid-binding protein